MDQQSLKKKTAKGLFWGGLSNSLQLLLNLVFGVFLLRKLSPSDYGMVGMLNIFSLIASSIQESGFTSALANKKEASHEDFNAVFWFSVIAGGGMYIFLFCMAPFISSFYHTPELTVLARYSFLGFFISSMGTAHSAYMFKNLMVKQKSISNFVSIFLSGVVGVTLAWNGMAYWGLVIQSLCFVSFNTILYWILSGWRPSLSVSFSPLKGMIAFSSRILFTNIFSTINNNLMTVVLGRFYTKIDVGYLNNATKWTSMGQMTILGMSNGVAQPVLREVIDDKERQVRVFRKMFRFVAFISFPAMFGLAFVAPELVTCAITAKWIGSIGLMQLLCIGAAFVPLSNMFSNLIVSHGRSNVHMWSTIFLGLIQLFVALTCYDFGIRVMVICYVLVNISWLFVLYFLSRKYLSLLMIDMLKDMLPFMLIAAICMGFAWFVVYSLNIEGIFSFVVKVIVSAILYITVMKILNVKTFDETISYFKKK